MQRYFKDFGQTNKNCLISAHVSFSVWVTLCRNATCVAMTSIGTGRGQPQCGMFGARWCQSHFDVPIFCLKSKCKKVKFNQLNLHFQGLTQNHMCRGQTLDYTYPIWGMVINPLIGVYHTVWIPIACDGLYHTGVIYNASH